MKKKKIFIFTIVSIISSMFIGLNCDAASRAYSVGTKWPAGTYGAGSDFATNVKNAANAYGKLSGYSSYYNTNPTYSYMKGNKARFFANILYKWTCICYTYRRSFKR